MAMGCFTDIIQILSPSWLPVAKHIGYIVELEENIDSLTKAMADLQPVKDDVKRKVDAAERHPQFKRRRLVQSWLDNVEAADGDVKKMKETFQQMRPSCLCSIRANCWKGYWLSKNAATKREDLVQLNNKGLTFDVVADRTLPDVTKRIHNTKTFGMELMLDKVFRLLGEDKASVVGIYGMGGVGKSTLLQEIRRVFAKRPHDFSPVIFAEVSKEVNVGTIQKKVGKQLGLSWPETESEETRALDIYEALLEKRFLLLLDDLWTPLDLQIVGIPDRDVENKGKIVFATRDETICGPMEAKGRVRVDLLPEKEAWDLFRDKVGKEAINSHPAIPTLAMRLAKKCGGLPLALITIGGAMSTKKKPQEWNHAITTLSTARPLSEISGMDNKMFLSLKFSYDNLQGETVKSCFLYCSLFPEDYSIDTEDLIDYWVGEGLLDGWFDDLDAARDKGHDLIRSLKVACLLESGADGETQVKMHDLIRDMALWIASDRFLVQANRGLKKAPEAEKWKEAERISLMENNIKMLPAILPTCPNLSTLLLQRNRPLQSMVSDFFQSILLLKVLDLSFSGLREVPVGIGCLINLQYLNLSHTYIESLPEEMGNLVRLRHLDLWKSNVRRIPRGVMSMLSSLKTLKIYYRVRVGIQESSFIEELEGLKYLSCLDISLNNVSFLNSLVGSSTLSMLTRNLELYDCIGAMNASAHISTILRVMRHLKRLALILVKTSSEQLPLGMQLTRLAGKSIKTWVQLTIGEEDSEGVNNNGFDPNLEILELIHVSMLKTVCFGNSWYFQSLLVIRIFGCHKLNNIKGLTQLKYLERLEVSSSDGLKQLICDSGAEVGGEQQGLTSLKYIDLDKLPNLTSVCDDSLTFPSFETIKVNRCPKLKKLPLGLRSSVNNTP